LRQLSYLKSLANRTGQTFSYPHLAAEASAEINRLKTPGRPPAPSPGSSKLIADQIHAGSTRSDGQSCV
jgi:hypothetical protein